MQTFTVEPKDPSTTSVLWRKIKFPVVGSKHPFALVVNNTQEEHGDMDSVESQNARR